MMSTEATRANIPTAPGGAHAAGDHAVPTRSPRNGSSLDNIHYSTS